MNKIIILVLSLPWLVSAENSLTFERAIQTALEKNIGIQQAGNNTEVSKNNASLANAGLLPRVDLSASANYTDATLQTAGGEISSTSTRNSTGLNASYSVFRGLQGINNYKLLKTQASATELRQELLVESTLLQVSQAYFSLLMTYDNLNILQDQMNVSRARLQQALDKNARGMSSSLQALAARVDFDNDSTSVLEAHYAFAEARQSLNLLLGWDLNETYMPENVERKLGEYLLEDMEAMSLTGNTTYLLSLNSEDQTELSYKNSIGSLMPTVNLTGSYGLQQINSDFDLGLNNADLSLTGGLSLSWNLFDGRKSKSIQSAKILLKNSELDALDASRQVAKAVESAYRSYVKSLQVLELKQTSLASAKLNFEQTQEYFNLGQVSSTQFRESQLNLSRVKSSLSQSKYSAYLDEIRLWQLTGQILDRI